MQRLSLVLIDVSLYKLVNGPSEPYVRRSHLFCKCEGKMVIVNHAASPEKQMMRGGAVTRRVSAHPSTERHS